MNIWNRIRHGLHLLNGKHGEGAIVINGTRLTSAQVAALRRLSGQPMPPPGNYWFDPVNGNLGWIGSPVPYFNLYAGRSPLAGAHGQEPTPAERQRLFAEASLDELWMQGG